MPASMHRPGKARKIVPGSVHGESKAMSIEDAIACGKRDHMLGPKATRVLIAELERLARELEALRDRGLDEAHSGPALYAGLSSPGRP